MDPRHSYATFPSDTDHRYRYARFTGSGWFDPQLATAGASMTEDPGEPTYSGGITIDADDPDTLLLSRQIRGVFWMAGRYPSYTRFQTRIMTTG